jgi:thiamine-phosphate pyrophosphorylase
MRVHAIVASLEDARRAVAAGATVVQLRVKAPTAEVVERGHGFDRLGVTFVVNDDVDAAVALRAHGVHLGQGDPGSGYARSRGLLLGRSVTALEQVAAGLDADYLGAGPVWETPSKLDADPPLGLEGLRAICAATRLPVIAIGGVDATNAAACIQAGAAGVATIRAAFDPAVRKAVDEALRDG